MICIASGSPERQRGGLKMNKTKTIVGIGLFTAIVVVLQLLGGGIRFGMFSISLVKSDLPHPTWDSPGGKISNHRKGFQMLDSHKL